MWATGSGHLDLEIGKLMQKWIKTYRALYPDQSSYLPLYCAMLNVPLPDPTLKLTTVKSIPSLMRNQTEPQQQFQPWHAISILSTKVRLFKFPCRSVPDPCNGGSTTKPCPILMLPVSRLIVQIRLSQANGKHPERGSTLSRRRPAVLQQHRGSCGRGKPGFAGHPQHPICNTLKSLRIVHPDLYLKHWRCNSSPRQGHVALAAPRFPSEVWYTATLCDQRDIVMLIVGNSLAHRRSQV